MKCDIDIKETLPDAWPRQRIPSFNVKQTGRYSWGSHSLLSPRKHNHRFSSIDTPRLVSDQTQLEWPSRVGRSLPMVGSQSLMVLPSEPDASSWLFGEKAVDWTEPESPLRVRRSLPVVGSQSLMVLSPEPDASSWLFGEKATDQTQSEWPLRVCRSSPVVGSQVADCLVRRLQTEPNQNGPQGSVVLHSRSL